MNKNNNELFINNGLNKIVDEKVVSFHMPGHKNGKLYNKLEYTNRLENLYKNDTTEIPGTDNLHSPEDIIKNSILRAQKVFKSGKTYYLINGSTCGIEAAIMAMCSPKDKLILSRDSHQSAVNGCILGDIVPIYIKSKIDKYTNIQRGNSFDDVKKEIDENQDAKVLFLTYPTYYGITFELKKMIDYAHSKGIIVIIDEAHGAHLGLSEKLPKTALECGADIVIQSTHKTLPAFTQSSMMHISKDALESGRVDTDRIEKMLKMTETSSPSYILMQSLEIAVDIYEKYGKELMEELLENIDEFKKNIDKIKEDTNKLENKNVEFFNIHNENDLTKVFISSLEVGLTGYEFEEILRKEHNIQAELSNYSGVLMITTIGNEKQDFEKLENALIKIYKKSLKENLKKIEPVDYPYELIPQMALTPREAFYYKKAKKNVKIEEAIGKICGENIVPYPPGVCMIAAGEIIPKKIMDYLKYCKKEGMEITGVKDSKFEYIQIIDAE
ncbi:aminotransferase class I/II-fold pyridoxal phosphate-dependent enzyme [Peptacetobacter hiranonis]|uniref:aminotransferase class I/II-fold pyridoxal phosphate-dependent enzyme n=1 Tax=Peptacetobacter hiranonis TaxID=89152 RepID=UPI002E779BD1|nr:aminotransferase class I/II-fold pyridoxal phosphate-dependent enzyme [Peptacetobacter hiranonis]MEE0248374.1 aminotransferase class V-fold PLP-dependent enzyme [Peptacetobacter hiranonis]